LYDKFATKYLSIAYNRQLEGN